MKKLLIFLIAVCGLFYACTSGDEPVLSEPSLPTQYLSDIYSVDEAVAIANDIAAELDLTASRSSSRMAVASNVVNYKTSKSRNEESLFYVVNYDDNQGYAIIAKKRIAQPVMAVINEGTYVEGEVCENPGFNMFMDAAGGLYEIDSTIKPIGWEWKPGDGPIPATQYKTVKDTLASSSVAPKMQLYKWGQKNPEGAFCPNGISGCANTAMFFVLAYFKSPTILMCNYDGKATRQALNWSEILNHRYSSNSDLYCCTSNKAHSAIAATCRQLGYLAKSDYSDPQSTSTNKKYYVPTLRSLLPARTITELKDFDFFESKTYLENGIVLMRGDEYEVDRYDNKLKYMGGHAWIMDGYTYTSVRIKVYKKAYNDLSWVLESTSYETKKLISINWGWNGSKNGYYNANVLNPDSESEKYYKFLDTQYIGIE